jgi:uncharacterized protein YrrD
MIELYLYSLKHKLKYMKRNIYSLLGFSLSATDGEVGKVEEFYFDDQNWRIRYLIVKTGNWLSGRKVLISPLAIVRSNWKDGSFPVNLTKEQIMHSPDIDTDKPVSLQHELSLSEHYLWQPYMDNGFYAPVFCEASNSEVLKKQAVIIKGSENNDPTDDNLHLRSTRRIIGYHIHATDGEIGHVSDFIVDDESWKLVYLVVAAKSWFGNKKVLISVQDIREISLAESEVYINISVNAVKQSKTLDRSTFTDSEIVRTLFI